MPTNKGSSRPAPRRGNASSRNSRRRRRANLPPGTVVEKYREILAPVVEGTQMHIFKPGSTGMANLDAKAQMYEMYRLRGPVHVTYKPAVGTTVAGQLVMGVDYDPSDAALTFQATAALSPKAVSPVWRDSSLTIPPGRAMKQKWLYTDTQSTFSRSTQGTDLQFDLRPETAAFGLQVTSTGVGNVGTLWVEYNIEFCSPRQPLKVGNATLCQQPNGQEQNNATEIMGLTQANALANLMPGVSHIQYLLLTGPPRQSALQKLLQGGTYIRSVEKVTDLGWKPNPHALPSGNPGDVIFNPYLVTLDVPETNMANVLSNWPPVETSSTSWLLFMLLSSLSPKALRKFVEGGITTWDV